MKLRWGIASGAVALLLVLVLGGYWWYRQREPARDGAPSWAPDSQALVFSAEIGTRKGDIFWMRADGTDRENLTDNSDANEGSPAMSPDGQHVAFESDRDGNVEIYVMNRNKSGVRRLTNNPAEDRSPAWSPDGSRIAFMSDRGGRVSPDLYTMTADGSDVQRLTTQFSNWAPQYAPDGKQLAFQMNRDVNVLDLATRAVRRLTFDPQNGMGPTWSPDGKRIAFVTTRNGSAELFTMNADGSDQKVAVSMPDGNAIDPRWSPDGRTIAFVLVPGAGTSADAAHVQAIYTFDVTSGVVTRLSR
jgi:Tol biopolymer transport system component